MLEENFQHFQTHLLSGLVPEALEPKAFVSWGNSLLSTLRKCKSYLRADPDNKHWLEVRKKTVDQLADMAKMVPGLINDPALDDSTANKVYDFVRKTAELLYEERQNDQVKEEKPKMNISRRMDSEHFKALQRLQGQIGEP